MKITHYFKTSEEQSTSLAEPKEDVKLDKTPLADDDVHIIPKSVEIIQDEAISPLKEVNSPLESKKIKKRLKVPNEKNSKKTLKDSDQKSKRMKHEGKDSSLMENKVASKHKKQKSLNAFFSPSSARILQFDWNENNENIEPIGDAQVLTDEERKALDHERKIKMIQNGTKRLERTVLSLKKDEYTKILTTLSRLNDRYVDMIPNPFLKYALKKEIAIQKRNAIMKNMTRDEKIKYRKENAIPIDKVFNPLLEKFLRERYEDTRVETKEFYDIPFVSLPNESATFAEFGKCLQISEFLFVHSQLLNNKTFFSAEQFHSALYSGKAGFEDTVGPVVKTLVYFLVDSGYKRNCKKLQSFVGLSRSGTKLLLKIVQLLLLSETGRTRMSVDEMNSSNEDFDDEPSECIKNALEELGSVVEFYNMLVDHQLEVILCIIERIMSRLSFSCSLLDTSELDIALDDLKDLTEEVASIQQDLKSIPPTVNEDGEVKLTRAQSAENSRNERMRIRRQAQLDELTPRVAEQERYVNELKQIDRMRSNLLGYDRFYRKYWFFGTPSPNKGVFVEEAYPIDVTKDMMEDGTVDDFDNFMNILEENLNGLPPPPQQNVSGIWRCVRNKNELDELIACLCPKGLREIELKRSILVVQYVYAAFGVNTTEQKS